MAAVGLSSLETKENDEKRVSALPLAQRTRAGQVLRVLACGRTLSRLDEFRTVFETQAKPELSAKRSETKLKSVNCWFSLGKRWFSTQIVFLRRVEYSGECGERLLVVLPLAM